MFKKKPQIKNLSPLRSSDRRRLADQIIQDYNVPLPPPLPELTAETSTEQPTPETALPPAPTLSSLRASLLPESSLSARFTTTTGPNSTPVSGTVYVGSQPGQPERILWFQVSTDRKLYPTIYTLWKNPGIVPLLHTQAFVVEKLQGGADMMTPGLVGGPPWPESATKGSVVAVASVEPGKDTVPMWIGTCEVDICALGNVQGSKGRAIRGLHWAGDEVWSWSSGPGIGGGPAPDSIQGWSGLRPSNGHQQEAAIERGMEGLDLEDDRGDEEGQEDGGVALGQSQSSNGHTNAPVADGSGTNGNTDEDDYEPETSEVDSAFISAFLYSLYDAKKHNPAEPHGLDLPILPSYLISKMIQPYLQFQNQHYTIKKTSWKNTKKFIKHLDKDQIVKSKDRNGGETVILDIDFKDQRICDFVPYRLPKPKTSSNAEASASSNAATSDSSVGQMVNLVTLFRPSPRLVPDLLPSKTTFYTPSHLSSFLKTYISNNPDLTKGTSSPNNVRLNPFIANNILGPNTTAADSKALAAGEIPRNVLLKRIQDDSQLCPVFWVLLKSDQHWNPDDGSGLPKPKPGPLPKAHITTEKRTGSKVVTKISNLETFNISPGVLAPELQKKCAGSASVGQLVGGKPGMMEILVQGDQREIVSTELGKRGVLKTWIEITDKTKKGGKGGAGGGGGGRR